MTIRKIIKVKKQTRKRKKGGDIIRNPNRNPTVFPKVNALEQVSTVTQKKVTKEFLNEEDIDRIEEEYKNYVKLFYQNDIVNNTIKNFVETIPYNNKVKEKQNGGDDNDKLIANIKTLETSEEKVNNFIEMFEGNQEKTIQAYIWQYFNSLRLEDKIDVLLPYLDFEENDWKSELPQEISYKLDEFTSLLTQIPKENLADETYNYEQLDILKEYSKNQAEIYIKCILLNLIILYYKISSEKDVTYTHMTLPKTRN